MAVDACSSDMHTHIMKWNGWTFLAVRSTAVYEIISVMSAALGSNQV